MAKALIRTPREVDALYSCLETVGRALDGLEPPVPWTLVAGSLLGALRSQSFLFCDDDVDIAVFESDYARVLKDLPAALGKEATLTRRPFPAADRIRPRNCTQVWIDLFVLRRFESMDEIRELVACKANGAAQLKEADAVVAAISHGAPTWPLYHYDNRLALQLWPREYWTPAELLPLQRRAFGHLHVPTPARPLRPLKRAYGPSCFEEYVLPVQHGAYHAETAARLAQMRPDGAADSDAAPWPRALRQEQFTPVTHSRHRPPSLPLAAAAARAALLAEMAFDDGWDGGSETDPSTWPLSPSSTSSSSSSSTPKHLGATLAALTGYSQEPFDFSDPRLVAALEPHVNKARVARQAGVKINPADGRRALPRGLTTEGQGRYLQSEHPLADSLATALGLADCPESTTQARKTDSPRLLAALHTHAPGKHAAAARLRDQGHRAGFHAVYDAFVQRVVLPYLASLAGAGAGAGAGGVGDGGGGERCVEMGRVRVQSFPCLRLILPGEFSLGAHCDTRYGHDPANINVVVPLTPAGASCASLYAETALGREDWHPVGVGGPGTFAHFHGGQCLHWTSENHSGATRASLDFRVLWAGALAGEGGGEERAEEVEGAEGAEGPAGDKYIVGSYYCEWECWEGTWRRCGVSSGPLPAPDERVGYPFVGVRSRPRG